MAADDPAPARIEELERQIARIRRRQRRNERAAWANGFLTDVTGMLKPGDIAIDCGANAGDISDKLLSSGAEVIAFDPEQWAHEKLTARFAANPRFTLHPVAVGTAPGTVRLMRASNFSENEALGSVKSTIVAGGRNIDEDCGNSIEVAQIDFIAFLRDLIATRGEVAFLEIDIEGAELDLIPAIHAAGLFRSIRCTVVETHERKFRNLRQDFTKLRDLIASEYAPSHVNLDWI